MPAFVGREAELALLSASVGAAAAGRGELVLVAGEPGVGKSMLLEEAGRRAAAAGAQVAWGRAWESGGAPPYWPWIQVLRVLGRDESPEPTPSLGADADRFQLFDGVWRFLAARAEARPLVVLLDDLHAADPGSLLLLAFAAGQIAGARVAIIAAYRDVEARLSADAHESMERLIAKNRMLALGRFGPSEVARLCALEAPAAPPAELVTRVCAATEGNALFVRELMRLLAARGLPAPGDELPVPESVRGVIRERLRKLPADVAETVAAAAILGGAVAVGPLSEMLAIAPDALAERLGAAVRAGVLVQAPRGGLAFSHGLLCDTILADLPAATRAALHLAAAETLERRHAGDPTAPVLAVAHHLLAAGPAHAARAVAAARRAGERALHELAYEDAAAILVRALGAHAEAAPGDALGRAELLLALADARLRAGDVLGGRAACRDAAAAARSLGHAELQARAALLFGSVFTPGVVNPELVALLEEALRAVRPDDVATRVRLLARLAGALQPAHDPEEPIALARRAFDEARALGDERVLLDVLLAGMSALMAYGAPSENLPLNRETAELATRLGDRRALLRALLRLIYDHGFAGEPAAVRQVLHEYEVALAGLGQPHVRWPLHLGRAMLALFEGRFDEDERLVAEAERLVELAGDENGRYMIFFHRDAALRLRDRTHDGALRRIADLPAIQGAGRAWHVYLAALQVERGELVEARATLELASGPSELPIAILGAFGAEAAAALRDAAWGARFEKLLAPRASGCYGFGTLGMVIEGPMARPLALCRLAQGDLAGARRGLGVAAVRARELGARPCLARILVEHAEISDDVVERARLAAEALEIASALGFERLAARARAAAAAAATPTLYLDGDTWVASGLGESCRLRDSRGLQILAQLVRAPGRELHVLDLAAGDGFVDGGDAGELLDEKARARYRARAGELRETIEDAEARGDEARAGRAQEELDALTAELSRAVGLGGRPRRAGAAAERARVNVQRRVTDALRRIGDRAPTLGRHLALTVRTGVYCSYVPDRDRRA